MYCSECGTKCKKTDAFCGECGHPLEKEEEVLKEERDDERQKQENIVKETKIKKPMSKKTKILIVSILVVCALLFGSYQFGSHIYSPKNVANTYIKALKKQDSDKLYTYLELEEDTTFATKKIFKQLNNDESKKTIENYTITDVTYGAGKLSATVSFKYTVNGSTSETTGQVYLTKKDNKKMLFFDDWQINNSNETSIVKEYTLNVPKGAKVTYADVEVTDTYLSENKNTNYDTYVLPQVFALKTKVKATLENGIVLEEDITPSNYANSVTLNLTKESLSEEISKNINEKATEIITTVYNGAIDGKSFEEIKESFEGNDVDLENLETKYNSFKDSVTSATNQLTKIDFTDVSIYSLAVEEENLRIRFLTKYDYSVKYKSYFSDEEEIHDDSSSSYLTLVLGFKGDNYYLVDFDYLPTYFSRY